MGGIIPDELASTFSSGLLQTQAACCTDLLPFDVASSSFDLLDYGYCSDE